MRPLSLHVSALTDTEHEQYTRLVQELSIGEVPDGTQQQVKVISAREARAWIRGRYARIGAASDTILRYFAPELKPGDLLTHGELFAALRIVIHVDMGKEVHRDLAFVQVLPEVTSPDPSDAHHKGQTRPLHLDISALSEAEYQIVMSASKVLADNEDLDEIQLAAMTIYARELRAWIRGRYPHIGAATINQIMSFFTPEMNITDSLSAGQLYAALRMVMHAAAGKDVHHGLAFVQALIDDRSPSITRQTCSPLNCYNAAAPSIASVTSTLVPKSSSHEREESVPHLPENAPICVSPAATISTPFPQSQSLYAGQTDTPSTTASPKSAKSSPGVKSNRPTPPRRSSRTNTSISAPPAPNAVKRSAGRPRKSSKSTSVRSASCFVPGNTPENVNLLLESWNKSGKTCERCASLNEECVLSKQPRYINNRKSACVGCRASKQACWAPGEREFASQLGLDLARDLRVKRQYSEDPMIGSSHKKRRL